MKNIVNLFIRTFARLTISPQDLTEKKLSKTSGMYRALISAKAFLEADQFASLPKQLRRLFCNVMVSTKPLSAGIVEYSASAGLANILENYTPFDLVKVMEGHGTLHERGMDQNLGMVERDLENLFTTDDVINNGKFLDIRNELELKKALVAMKQAWQDVPLEENEVAEQDNVLLFTLAKHYPVVFHHMKDTLSDILPGIAEFDSGMFPDDYDEEMDSEYIDYDGDDDWVETDDEEDDEEDDFEESDDEEDDEEDDFDETDTGDIGEADGEDDDGEKDDGEKDDEEDDAEETDLHYMTRDQRLSGESDDSYDDAYAQGASANDPTTGKPYSTEEEEEEPDDEDDQVESTSGSSLTIPDYNVTQASQALKDAGVSFTKTPSHYADQTIFTVNPADVKKASYAIVQSGLSKKSIKFETVCGAKLKVITEGRFSPDPDDTRNIYWAAGGLNDPLTGKPYTHEAEGDSTDEPDDAPADEPTPEECAKELAEVIASGVDTSALERLGVLFKIAKKGGWSIEQLAEAVAKHLAVLDHSFNQREFLKLAEAWSSKTKVDPKEKGKYKDVNASDLRRQYKSLKSRGPHKEGSTENLKMKELAFAIRAKTGWGKVDAEVLSVGIDRLQEKMKKITTGMMNAMGRTVNARYLCSECGMAVPVYSGRYPAACPNCGTGFVTEPVEEAKDISVIYRVRFTPDDMKKMFKLAQDEGEFGGDTYSDSYTEDIVEFFFKNLALIRDWDSFKFGSGFVDTFDIPGADIKLLKKALSKYGIKDNIKESIKTPTVSLEEAYHLMTCPKCSKPIGEAVKKSLAEFEVKKGAITIVVDPLELPLEVDISTISNILSGKQTSCVVSELLSDEGLIIITCEDRTAVKEVEELLNSLKVQESAYEQRTASPAESLRLSEQIPATDADSATTDNGQAPATEPQPAPQATPSQDGEKSAPEQPDEVATDEEGGEDEFTCPNCNAQIPKEDLKRMLGKLLHQVATQLEQGATTDDEPETGPEEAPTDAEPKGEEVPPAPAPSQAPPAAAPVAPAAPAAPAESVIDSLKEKATRSDYATYLLDRDAIKVLNAKRIRDPQEMISQMEDDGLFITGAFEPDNIRNSWMVVVPRRAAHEFKVWMLDQDIPVTEASKESLESLNERNWGSMTSMAVDGVFDDKASAKAFVDDLAKAVKGLGGTIEDKYVKKVKSLGNRYTAAVQASPSSKELKNEFFDAISTAFTSVRKKHNPMTFMQAQNLAKTESLNERRSSEYQTMMDLVDDAGVSLEDSIEGLKRLSKEARKYGVGEGAGLSARMNKYIIPSLEGWIDGRHRNTANLEEIQAEIDQYFDNATESIQRTFKPLTGELLVPADRIPEKTELRIIDRINKKAIVEYGNALHTVSAKNVLVFEDGMSLDECLEAVKTQKMTVKEAARKRLQCRRSARRLSDLPETKVLSDTEFMIAYLPTAKAYRQVLAEVKRHMTVGAFNESNTLYAYPKDDSARALVVKCVEKHKGHVIQSRVAFGYDPSKKVSEQIGGGDENADVISTIDSLFLSSYNNIKQMRQLLVDAQSSLLKGVALLQGASIGKKTQSALQKLASKMDIESQVKEQTKMIAELNKAHDMFIGEFPEAKEQTEMPAAPDPEPEVAPVEQPPVEQPAVVAEPAAPVTAPEAAPAAAPAAEAVIEAALKSLQEGTAMPLIEGLLQDAAPYVTIAQVIKDECPNLSAAQIQVVVHRLI